MTRTEVFTFNMPSGGKWEAREMTVEDVNALVSGKNAQDALNGIIRKNVTKCTDNGIPILEDSPNATHFDSLSAPLADLFTATVMLRRATHGNDFWFKAACPFCQHSWHHCVDLSEDRFAPRPIKWTTDGDLTKGVDPKTLTFIIRFEQPYKGVEAVKVRLFRGMDQEELSRIRVEFKDKKMSEKIKMMIVGVIAPGEIVNGTPVKKVSEKGEIQVESNFTIPTVLPLPEEDWILKMGFNQSQYIDEIYNSMDGGIETNIDVECPKCNETIEEVSLPITDKNFFSRKSAMKPSGKR